MAWDSIDHYRSFFDRLWKLVETFLYNILNKNFMAKTIVLSLGGSLIYPDKIDANFLRNFKKTIEKHIKKGNKFVIYCGGGALARMMQQEASKAKKLDNKQLDEVGIIATKMNAAIVRESLREYAEDFIIENPSKKINFRKKIIVAAGWKPGWSTDYDAVLAAKNISSKEVINMSNVDYVYDKDPRKHRDAKKIESIRWKDFTKLVGKKWKAGMHAPFDPIAAKEAQKSKIKVFIIGRDLKNLENLLNGKKFKGTVIK